MNDNSIFKKVLIRKIISESTLAKTFILEPLNGWKPIYQAGQFVTFVFQTPFGEKRRSYSISTSPDSDEYFAITIKRMENGEFSRWFIDHAKEGDELISTGVSGLFILPESFNEIDHVVFFAAGSGITPCYSLIKSILKKSDKKIALIYSSKNIDETIFYKDLTDLSKTYNDRLKIIFLFSQEKGNKNRLSQIVLEEILDENKFNERTFFYICGPLPYMRIVNIILLSEGYSNDKIKRENFNDLPPPELRIPPDVNMHNVLVHINKSKYLLNVKFPDSIITTAKANNIELPYSCEAGRCGSCIAKVIKGKIWMNYNEVLTDREVKDGMILACQGFAVDGDAEIEF